MTTGTTGTLSPGGWNAINWRTWSGGDGKYVAGTKRSRWNNYTMRACNRAQGPGPVVKYRLQSKTDPNQYFDGQHPCSFVNTKYYPSGYTVDPNLVLKVMSKLAEKARGHEFNLAVSLAEANKTADMATSNLLKLARGMRALKTGNFAGAARALGARRRTTRLKPEDVSGRWLELQYGWYPLVHDVYEASKAYEAITSGPRFSRFTASSSNKRTYKVSASGGMEEVERNEVVRHNIIALLEEDLSVSRQLGLLNPASVVWELIPYSFVVDWFIPVGTYLDNLSIIPSLKGKFLSTTFAEDKTTGSQFVGVWQNSSTRRLVSYSGYVSGWNKQRGVYLKRVASSSLSVPLPKPKFKGAISTKRFWNALALAHQAFSR